MARTYNKAISKAISKTFVIILCCMWLSNELFSTERAEDPRKLSLNLGNGACKWQPPEYDTPEDVNFYKTMVVGFPSGDKRLTFVQMEALTGLAAKDEWDFEFLGMTNNPFIKANYPHHEGIWGWEDAGDQVVMVVRNMRRSMVEYHDILWDIGYAKTWEQATEFLGNLYQERPPLEDFLGWRDERVMDEIHWYGWFIDYWMEAGLLRDIFTHKITTYDHWKMLMQPTAFTKDESAYDLIVGDKVVTPTYDPNCHIDNVSGGCHPIQIISAERLVKAETGPDENRKIAQTLKDKEGIGDYLIAEEAWQCIWTELIINKKGLKTFIDREGIEERDYNFSTDMLSEMLLELDRLIEKYGSEEWNDKQTSQDLVGLFNEHRQLIQTEYNEVSSGERQLKDSDFLGPEERKRRKKLKFEKELSERVDDAFSEEETDRRLVDKLRAEEKKDYSAFFANVERKLLENRRQKIKSEVFAHNDMIRSLSRAKLHE